MTIIYVAALWCLGIWVAVSSGGASTLWGAGIVASTLFAFLSRGRRQLFVAAVCVVSFCAGALRASTTSSAINVDHFVFYGNDPEVTLSGTIIEPPRVYETSMLLTVQVEAVHGAGQEAREAQGRVLLHAPRFPPLGYGDRLRFTGRPERVQNWGDFDYREFMARQGVHYELRGAQISVLQEGQGHRLYQALYGLRGHAQGVIAHLLPSPESALLSGILLGDDSGMPRDLRADFRTTGMSHIIAISGFNIAILAGALLRGGRRLLGLRASGWVALAGILIYTLFVGAGPSVVRAAIMGGLYIFSNRVLGRPTFAPAGLFVAALLMSLLNPFVLWEIGFQLSFAATLGLMLFVEPAGAFVQARLARRLPGEAADRLMPLLSDVVIVTVAAQLMTLPLLAYHFGEVSPVSLLANLLILPAQPGVMLWGGAAALLGLLSPALAQPIAWVAWLFLSYSTHLVALLARLPYAVVAVRPGFWTVALCYALLGAAAWLAYQPRERRASLWGQARGRALRSAPALMGLSLGLALLWSRSQPDGHLHVVFLDVGQGDAIFIQTPGGRQMLVDGGQFPAALNAHLGRQMPFWDRSLDMVVATHPDDDHVAGLPELFDRYRVDLLLTNGAAPGASRAYEQLLRQAAGGGALIRTPAVGERLEMADGVTLTFLHPAATPLPADNDNSVALHLAYGQFSLLLTGDGELEAERAMMASGLPLRALVFKAGHHGSRTSSNRFFLEAVQPQIVVISAGADNHFDHPHEELLERAAEVGATVLRTDELGTIEMVTDGERMWWTAER